MDRYRYTTDYQAGSGIQRRLGTAAHEVPGPIRDESVSEFQDAIPPKGYPGFRSALLHWVNTLRGNFSRFGGHRRRQPRRDWLRSTALLKDPLWAEDSAAQF